MACAGIGAVEADLQAFAAQIEQRGLPGDPLEFIGPASRGDIEAQRNLAMWGVVVFYRAPEVDQTATFAEAIMMARLAAAQGDRDDEYRLATLLALGSAMTWNNELQDEWGAECVARLELLADAGDDRSADLLAAFAGRENCQVLEGAREFRARLIAAKEAE
jgi:hypothetical protein